MLLKSDDKEDAMMHTKTMERAMGYANECSDRAEEYMAEAGAGMKEGRKGGTGKSKRTA